jgi:hypothetical protein
MSHVEYGAYVHPDNEANLTMFRVVPLYTSRGFRWGNRYTAEIQGEILETTQAAFNTKINGLINAYADNGNDFGFYDNDGTLTNHSITSSASISGTKIILRDWPKSDGAEWATKRTFRVRLQADFVDVESELKDFKESITHVGIAGQRKRLIPVDDGEPETQTIVQQHPQQIIQQGYAVGQTTWPIPPGPILVNSKTIELTDQRQVVTHSPKRDRNGFMDYRIDWQYVMLSFQNNNLFPNTGG